MLGGIGPTELIIVLFIILIVFGGGRLPDLASGLGKGVRNFKKEMRQLEEMGLEDTSKRKQPSKVLQANSAE